MGRKLNLIGRTFGRLTVVDNAPNKNNKTYWLCKCECGNITKVDTGALKSGNTKSCGCLNIDKIIDRNHRNSKHNMTNSKIYQVHKHMKERCYKEYHKSYNDYGGRGIKVCDEWLNKDGGFENFYKWAIENGYSENLTLDRKDVNGNYEPDNCRWVDNLTQCNNKRNNFYIEINGVIKTASEWGKGIWA